MRDLVEPRELDDGRVQVPLRQRMPGYLASFGKGLAVSSVIGVLVWAVTDVSLVSSLANTIFFYGIALFLIGGVSGGGYSYRSARAAASFDQTRQSDNTREVGMAPSATPRTESHRHVPQVRGPEPKSKALWQVMGGGLYVAIGLFIVIMWS